MITISGWWQITINFTVSLSKYRESNKVLKWYFLEVFVFLLKHLVLKNKPFSSNSTQLSSHYYHCVKQTQSLYDFSTRPLPSPFVTLLSDILEHSISHSTMRKVSEACWVRSNIFLSPTLDQSPSHLRFIAGVLNLDRSEGHIFKKNAPRAIV